MWTIHVVLLLCQASLVFLLPSHQSWIPHLPCDRSTRILNDCNWCRCIDSVFQCMTRDCRMVDKFAHFNEAIQPIKVGMEGHGRWRSGPAEMGSQESSDTETTTTEAPIEPTAPSDLTEDSCSPGVHYARDDLVCVCTKKGTWPHRKCRVIFNKLIEVDKNDLSTFEDKCTPGHTYLVQCNICICNKAGRVYEPLCTKMDCKKLTPAILESEEATFMRTGKDNKNPEVYAECTEDVMYKLGCRTCICQRNNRLVCDKCDEFVNRASDNTTVCSSLTPGVVFNVDCNLCFCDKAGYTVCTMRLCAGKDSSKLLKESVPNIGRGKPAWVEAPANDRDCVPNTSFRKGCNICECLMGEVKMLICTRNPCKQSSRSRPDTNELIAYIKDDCVEGTVYEADCRTCRCSVEDDLKREICNLDSVCGQEAVKARIPGVLDALHGYCEPLHVYKKDCNTCECLADGKTLRCTSKHCRTKPKLEKIYVEILPISSPNGRTCPKGAVNSYKVDCNYCFCLPNGNALCTSKQCNNY